MAQKLLILGDTHFGISAASDFYLKMQRQFFSRLINYMKENDITTLLHLGDLYDNRKSIDIRVLKESTDFFTKSLMDAEIDTWIIVGNHDTVYKNTIHPNTVRELLYWTPFHIIDKPTEMNVGLARFLLLPWMCPDNMAECLVAIDATNSDFCAGHLELGGYQYIPGIASIRGMDPKIFSKFKRVFSGHYHLYSEHGNVTYVGNPYQLNWNDHGQKKPVLVFNTDTGEYDIVNHLSDPIFEKVLNWNEDIELEQYDNKIVKCYIDDNTDRYLFDKWFGKLSSIAYRATIVEHSNVNDVSIKDAGDATKDTLQLLFDYIDEVYGSVGDEKTDAIKSLIQETYKEEMYKEAVV